MPYHRKYILGVGIDDLTVAQAVERMLKAASSTRGNRPLYCSLVSGDIISVIHTWSWNSVRNREVITVLQDAECILPDQRQWHSISSWLGEPIRESVSASELLTQLSQGAAQQKLSIYFLGHHQGDVLGAAAALQKLTPELRVAGSSTYHPAISGEELEEAPERDALVLEEIHQANPAILLLDLEPLAAHMWFARVQRELRVPLVLSVSGGFCLLSGCRLPEFASSHMQRVRAYLQTSAMKYIASALQRFSELMYSRLYSRLSAGKPDLHIRLFVSQTRTIAVIQLPSLVDAALEHHKVDLIEGALTHDHLIIDFRAVKHITLEGVHLLVQLWLQARRAEKEISGLGMSGDVRALLKANRAWYILRDHLYHTTLALAARLQQARHNALYESLEQDDHFLMLSLLGFMDNDQDYQRLFQQLQPMIQKRGCKLDFSYCAVIESRALSFLLHLERQLKEQGNGLFLQGVNATLKCQIIEAGLKRTLIGDTKR